MRIAAALILSCAFPLVACQPQRAADTAIAPGKTSAAELATRKEPERPKRGERIGVEVRVTRLGGGEAIAVTRGEIETEQSVRFETKQSGQVGEAEMSLHVESRGKGVYAVGFDWRETTSEGRSVIWSPTLAVVEGVEAAAEIAWSDGDGRRIALKLTKPPVTEASVAAR